MSKAKFNALASLAVLAAAPLAAQAEMTEMADTELSDVSGQGLIGDALGAINGSFLDPLINSNNAGTTTVTTIIPVQSCTGSCGWTDTNGDKIADAGDTYTAGSTLVYGPSYTVSKTTGAVVDNNYLPNTIGKAVGDSVDTANKGLINFHLLPLNLFGDAVNATTGSVRNAGNAVIGFNLLPITGPANALGSFNSRTLSNSATAGQQVADIAFAPIFKPIALAKQGVDTGLNYLFFPISAPLDVAGNVYSSLNTNVVGTTSRILTTPIRAVFNPINRGLDTAASIGKVPVNAVLNPINNVVSDVTSVAKGVATGVNYSFVGAIGGATTQVLAAATTATHSQLLYNMTIASNQARLTQQAKIAAPLNVTVTVPKITK